MTTKEILPRDETGRFPSGIFRYAGYDSSTELVEAAHAWGWAAWLVDGESVQSKPEFIGAIATALDLPKWQGKNWDALEETLRDLPETRKGENPASGYLIVLNTPRDWIRRAPNEWKTATSLLQEVSEFWRAQGVPFTVVLRRTYGMLENVPPIK